MTHRRLALIVPVLAVCGWAALRAPVAAQDERQNIPHSAVLPASCSSGDAYVDTAAPAFELCLPDNHWNRITPITYDTIATINPGLMAAGDCADLTEAVTGVTTSQRALANPVVDPGAGVVWQAFVPSAGHVTVRLCALKAVTPTASLYHVVAF